MSSPQLDRVLQTVDLVRREGPGGVGRRLVRRAYRRSGASALDFGLFDADVADSTTVHWASPAARPAPGTALEVGWITTPPRAGSGGHTTMFRMVQALVDAGHHCTLYLYDRYGGGVERHAAVIRKNWPWLHVAIADARVGLGAADAYVATSWETAHVLGVRGSSPGRRLYFVQDFEPFFHGHGSEYALAEDSYQFGFTTITVGRMIAEMLRRDHGVEAVVAEFGCDTSVYGLENRGARNGVVFYAKPDVPRRGFKLGMLALGEFHRRHPDQEIHLFGDPVGNLPFPATIHGTVSPADLAALYNSCIGGLAMSFTNMSLVPVEMLACGAVPVLNDSVHARPGLDNAHAVWAHPSPVALASALSAVVSAADIPARAAEVAASVTGATWDDAKAVVVETVEREVYGR